jgi:heat shock protein HslJ
LRSYTGAVADRALPRLPPAFASQAIVVKPAYIDNGVVSGIRYLTTYTQDPVFAITADRVEYTFQGISADGSRYISLISRLVTDALPAEAPADMLDDYPAYLARTVQMLNELDEVSFAPALNVLDSIALSLRIEGVSAPTVRPPLEETPSLGAIGGTWTLVSYGDPSAPTPVLDGTTITLTIDSLGVSGSAGCNNYFSGYAYAENTISFAALGATRMACDPPIMEQESAYLRALGSTETFEIVGNTLRIVYAGGVLTFEKSE